MGIWGKPPRHEVPQQNFHIGQSGHWPNQVYFLIEVHNGNALDGEERSIGRVLQLNIVDARDQHDEQK